MYRCATSWGDPGIVSRRKYARGKALRVAKPAFPPRAPPFRARSCCMLWKCEYVLVGRWILRCWQCNVTPIYTQVESAAPRLDISRQTTGKLSLSSRSSSAALMTHPTLGKPLYIPPRTKFSLQPLIPDHLITLPVIHSHHPT